MTPARLRLGALIAATMTLLAVLTTAESQDLHVVPAVEASTAAPAPAEAVLHTPNSYAFWACGATRQTEEHTLQHAHVVTLTPAYLLASCQSQAEDIVCFWDAFLWWNGVTSIAGGTAHCVIVG